ncbi:hypothetical protein EYC84_009625 [Monilinia fructicola]|uniref:SET domain-containing protein n=1 Tax=Monilinia fructicola TaxID=38448 RepID=A0A5M9JB32_MONFR|nr:hypothetical protein EYC84_009625 [Monilinia fructicola]
MASSSSNEDEIGSEIMEAFLALFPRDNIYVAQDRDGDTATMHAVFRTVAMTAAGQSAGSASAEPKPEGEAIAPVITPGSAAGAAIPSGLVLSSEESNDFAEKRDSKGVEPFEDNDSIDNDTVHPAPAATLKEEIVNDAFLSSRLFEIKPILLGTPSSPTSELEEGLFAIHPIPAYTEIFREAPLIHGGPTWLGREAAVRSLTASKKDAAARLMGVCHCDSEYCRSETVLMQIWDSNNYAADGQEDFIYANGSKINHACVSNCTMAFTPAPKSYVSIRTKRDLVQGEEITINYGCEGPFQYREEKFAKEFKFLCRCDACINKLDVPRTDHAYHSEHKLFLATDTTTITVLGVETSAEAAESKEIREWAAEIEKFATGEEEKLYNLYKSLISAGARSLKQTPHHRPRPVQTWFEMGLMKYLRGDNKYHFDEDTLQCYLYRITKKFAVNFESVNMCPGFIYH